jgi:hypothetical protein
MQVLTTNALDEDRYVYKNKNKGTHLLVHPLDSTEVSLPAEKSELDYARSLILLGLSALLLQPVPSGSPDRAAMAKVDQKLLAKVKQVSRTCPPASSPKPWMFLADGEISRHSWP